MSCPTQKYVLGQNKTNSTDFFNVARKTFSRYSDSDSEPSHFSEGASSDEERANSDDERASNGIPEIVVESENDNNGGKENMKAKNESENGACEPHRRKK